MISSAIIPQPLARLPWRLIFMIAAIGAIGLTTLYSAAGGSLQPWALRQGMTFLFFFMVALFMSWVRESTIKSLTIPVYIAIVIMLILVEMLGFVGKGAQRWLDLGFIRLQPSEFMKPAIVLVLARFYELLPPTAIRSWRAIWHWGSMPCRSVPRRAVRRRPEQIDQIGQIRRFRRLGQRPGRASSPNAACCASTPARRAGRPGAART